MSPEIDGMWILGGIAIGMLVYWSHKIAFSLGKEVGRDEAERDG